FTFTDPSGGGIRGGCRSEYDHCHTFSTHPRPAPGRPLSRGPDSGGGFYGEIEAVVRNGRRAPGEHDAARRVLERLRRLRRRVQGQGQGHDRRRVEGRPPGREGDLRGRADGAKDVSVLDPVKITVDGGELTDATVTS